MNITGRAIIQYNYYNKIDKQYYPSILLVKDKKTDKFFLPGGQFHIKQDTDALDTAIREVKEELNLICDKNSAIKIIEFKGKYFTHHIYLLNATGNLEIDFNEILGIAFYNAGKSKKIPNDKLISHAYNLKNYYFKSDLYTRETSGIDVPLKYL
jgi:ADP-ribose pyrophosphatase YjhB (NUDIX family)